MTEREHSNRRRLAGLRFMTFGLFGPMGSLGERLGLGHPLDDFDPEAFQKGAYGTPAPVPEERESD